MNQSNDWAETGQADASIDTAAEMLPRYLYQDSAVDLPVEGLSDQHDGLTNETQALDFLADTNNLENFMQDGQWDFDGVQSRVFTSSFEAPFGSDPLGSSSNVQGVAPKVTSEGLAPSLSDQGCSCLSKLYSTLASFQSLPLPSFPFSMGLLTKATKVAEEACLCKHCPTQYASALQNLMLLSTLLPLIAHEHGRLLAHIDGRASKGGLITLRVGEKEKSSEHVHSHTGTFDCPMAFDMDLSADEWRSMARKAIARRVIGSNETSVLGVLNSLECRQKHWHEHPILVEFQHGSNCHEHGTEVGDEHACLKMLTIVRRSIEALKLD